MALICSICDMSAWKNNIVAFADMLRKSGLGPGLCGSLLYPMSSYLLNITPRIDYFFWLLSVSTLYYHIAFLQSSLKKQLATIYRREGNPYPVLLIFLLFISLLLTIKMRSILLSGYPILFFLSGIFFLLSYPTLRHVPFLKNGWIASCWWVYSVFYPLQNIWLTADVMLILTGIELWLFLFIISLLADIPDMKADNLSQAKTWAIITPQAVRNQLMILLWIIDSFLLFLLWYFSVVPLVLIGLNGLVVWLFKQWKPEAIAYPLFDFFIVIRFLLLVA